MMKSGTVFLVGAGPGDPGLITLRGVECLRMADLIVYDRLANETLLGHANPSARMILMGKGPDDSPNIQDQILETMIHAAKSGLDVVRLKGGDPFVFGRGGEEAKALEEAGIKFEIVPGISSAIAVPAYSGIPVTHRGIATSFTVVSGSEESAKEGSSLDWEGIAKTPGTLVILMGWRKLGGIVQILLGHGKPPETPVSVIQWGTTSKQRTVTGELANIADQAMRAGLGSPAIIVIGPVVKLQQQLKWIEGARPLLGKKIVVTRSRSQVGKLARELRLLGAEVIEFPTIEIVPMDDYSELDEALDRLHAYQWLIFTSVNTVDVVFNRLTMRGRDTRSLSTVKVAAIGSSTAEKLYEHGVVPDFVPSSYVGESVIRGFREFQMDSARILLPGSDISSPVIYEGLQEMGARVETVPVYKTVVPLGSGEPVTELFGNLDADVVTFTSSSTVQNLVDLLSGDVSAIERSLIATIGPITSQTARGLNLRVDLESEPHTIPGLVQALVRYFRKNRLEESQLANAR